jgi:4-alpha-glucanotransferase
MNGVGLPRDRSKRLKTAIMREPTTESSPFAEEAPLVRAALAELGVHRLLMAIQDVSFPSDPDEDVGRGSPGTRASHRLLRFLRDLGFTGIQLGPQGQTSRDNPSPYDGTLFSRNVDSIALDLFASSDLLELVDAATLRDAVAPSAPGGKAEHARAHDTLHRILRKAFDAFETKRPPAVSSRFQRFRTEHARWLERDALYAVLSELHGGTAFRDWGEHGELWNPPAGDEQAFAARRHELARQHDRGLRHYAFNQFIAHEGHAAFRARTQSFGLDVYGDLQIGLSDADVWSHRRLLLRDYVMGAPPSRTTPEGQPWNYALLDPMLGSDGAGAGRPRDAALSFLDERIDKAFREYDGIRIDHPHGHVCPWVYRAGTADPGRAVREGARLFESPDLPDHPELARYARVTPEQIDRSRRRYDDGWAKWLTPDQVDRYAATLLVITEAAARHGRDISGIACEVLSTLPLPLARVLERLELGRFRVTQKANLDDPSDVYRTENAEVHDWIMLGNHDTEPIWTRLRSFTPAMREKWAAYLMGRLRMSPNDGEALAKTPGLLAQAMLADAFASKAENVMIFFGDLFGIEERYNVPGTIGDQNWVLRLPPSFTEIYGERRRRQAALDLPWALATALAARGPGDEHRAGLVRALRALGHSTGS